MQGSIVNMRIKPLTLSEALWETLNPNQYNTKALSEDGVQASTAKQSNVVEVAPREADD